MRVWGLLVDGKLNITVLPEEKVMNRWVYAKVIRQLFSKWCGRRRRPLVVQDYERCLRCDEPMEAFAAAGMAAQQDHPKYSQDLNAIENAYAFLRSRLADTQPKQLESRAAFCRRLRSANLWVNKNRKTALRYLCRNQKERARCLGSEGRAHEVVGVAASKSAGARPRQMEENTYRANRKT